MFKSLLNLFRKNKPAGYKVDLGNGDFLMCTSAAQATEIQYILQRNDEEVKRRRTDSFNTISITVKTERVQRMVDALNGVDSHEDTRVARQEHMPHNRIASGNHPELRIY